jgi:hypothetical protein
MITMVARDATVTIVAQKASVFILNFIQVEVGTGLVAGLAPQ